MSKTVLLVDDSATTLMIHELILTNNTPHAILKAMDGQEAVEKAMATKPDLILMDVVMPRMTGYEACKAMRQHESTRDIPVILVTTRGEEHSVETGYQSGCTAYITKPVNAGELVDVVESYLQQSEGTC